MLRLNRQSNCVANRFVKTRIGTISINHRLMFILHEILDVTQFMVDGLKVIHVDTCALFDSNVIVVVKVPSGGVAHQLPAIVGFFDDTSLPKGSETTWNGLEMKKFGESFHLLGQRGHVQ
jgi:hypothetical protein